MPKKNDGQIDIFNHTIFEKLIPKNHLLVKIDSIIDFSFVYEKIKDKYSGMGRGSKDPVMMVKILLLEYLYWLSDLEVSDRINTDVAFRWFLGLGIDDTIPDDTTISYFRIKRLGEEDFDEFFNEIILASTQPPFNTGDEKKLQELIEKVERRFATMVRNHGLRRCRYLRLKGVKFI